MSAPLKPYNQRRPEKTDLYRLVSNYYPSFKESYNDDYADIYGFYRPEIDAEIDKYLKCGIHKYGVARIKCQNKDCDEEYLLPFSCKGRGICPSCIQKQSLLTELRLIDENLLKEVRYRHLVLTIPKLLRKNFFWHRKSLNDLSRIAWKVIKNFMQSTLRSDGNPGGLLTIETCGQYLDLSPHIHAVVSDGVFEDEKFLQMPYYDMGAKLYIEGLWEKAVAKYCIGEGYVTEELVKKILKWRHTGFSVYTETKIDYKKDDEEAVKNMGHIIRYITKAPISLERLTFKEEKVLVKGEFHQGHKANFQIYSPLDFMAAYTSHIPNHRQKYTNYYGVYSNRTRGKKAEELQEQNQSVISPISTEEATGEQRNYKKTWAMLLQKIWEVDPLKCPKCGSNMKVIAVIDDAEVVREILKRQNMWHELEEERGPPLIGYQSSTVKSEEINEIVSEPFDDGWFHDEGLCFN